MYRDTSSLKLFRMINGCVFVILSEAKNLIIKEDNL